MSAVKHAVIAAAGLGSRLGLGKPKCLVEVAGAPLIAHQLAVLQNVQDVRVVVGFEERMVIDTVLKYRKDVLFVRNPAFRSTTTLNTFADGARFLGDPALFMDADIFFEPRSFESFIAATTGACPLIGITEAKTSDAVYAHLNKDGNIERFSRANVSPFEWANLVFAPPRFFEKANGAVFEHITNYLPLPVHLIESYEVDRPEDLEAARSFAEKIAAVSSTGPDVRQRVFETASENVFRTTTRDDEDPQI